MTPKSIQFNSGKKLSSQKQSFASHPSYRPEIDGLRAIAVDLSYNKQELLRRRKHIVDGLNSVATKHKNLYIYNPFEVLCPDDTTCSIRIDGRQMYRDEDHLSNLGAEYLYDDFSQFLKQHSIYPNTP